jgi:hypothetical protein
MVASPRNTEPKLQKKRGSYHEATQQLNLQAPKRNFSLSSTVGQYATEAVSKNIYYGFPYK